MRGTTTLDRNKPSRPSTGRRTGRVRWTRRARVLSAVFGCVLTCGTAFAATSWLVGLGANSSGQGQSGSVGNVSITASTSATVGNLLYPGGTGDVVVTITNGNGVPVTITAVTLPSSTTYAAGYTDSGLTSASTCTAAASYVAWNFATNTNPHTLFSPLTVGANSSLVVTLTNGATMGTSSANSCQSTYFKMPSLASITASAGTGTATVSPATDYWTS